MQSQASASNNLNENDLNRLDELSNELGTSGEFFKLADGQTQTVVFDLQNTPGTRTRIIQTKEGEKEITRFAFLVRNPKTGKNQQFELANRWVKKALEAMRDFQTTTLVVKRRGSTISDTEYSFLPVGLTNWSPSK